MTISRRVVPQDPTNPTIMKKARSCAVFRNRVPFEHLTIARPIFGRADTGFIQRKRRDEHPGIRNEGPEKGELIP